MAIIVEVLKALSVTLLASFGSGVMYHNGVTHSEGFGVSLGVFMVLGAAFLYRAWFMRGD